MKKLGKAKKRANELKVITRAEEDGGNEREQEKYRENDSVEEDSEVMAEESLSFAQKHQATKHLAYQVRGDAIWVNGDKVEITKVGTHTHIHSTHTHTQHTLNTPTLARTHTLNTHAHTQTHSTHNQHTDTRTRTHPTHTQHTLNIHTHRSHFRSS